MDAPTRAAVGKRRLLPRAARAASIRRAASRAFVRGGYSGTSMDDVAAEAGVTKLMLYRHFNSKRELYEAILLEVRSRLDAIDHRPATLVAIEPDQALREAEATLLATIRAARELPDAYRLLFEHAVHEPEFVDYAEAMRERGEAKAEALLVPLIGDPTVRSWAARMVATLTDEGVLAWLEIGEPDRDAYMAERLARVLGVMLGPLVS